MLSYEAILKRDRDHNAIMQLKYEQGEHSKAKYIAINMLKKNISITDISECTGLALKEVNELIS